MPNQPRDIDSKTTITYSPDRVRLFDDLLEEMKLKKMIDWGVTRNEFVLRLAEERARQILSGL